MTFAARKLHSALAVVCVYSCFFQQLQASGIPGPDRAAAAMPRKSLPQARTNFHVLGNRVKISPVAAPALLKTAQASGMQSSGNTLDFPFFEEDAEYSSVLMLNNNGLKTVAIQPVIYNVKGDAYQAPAIRVTHAIPLRVPLSDLISNAPDGFTEGNVHLQYEGQSMQVTGQVSIVSNMQKGSFESLMDMESSGSKLEEVLAFPSANSSVHLAVTNFSGVPTPVQLRVNGQPSQPPFILQPRQTHVMTKHDILGNVQTTADSALVSFSTPSASDEIGIAGAVLDERAGYSSTLFFTNPASDITNLLAGTHFLSGAPADPDKRGGSFTASLALANTSSFPITVNSSVDYTLKDSAEKATLPPVTLSAYETRNINLTKALEVQGVTEFLDNDGIELTYSGGPGSLVAHLTSMNDAGDFAIDTPIKNPESQWGAGSGSHPWRTDGDYRSTLYLKNVLNRSATAVVQVSYESGVYLPNTFFLKPHQTMSVDLNQLAAQHKKDIKGRFFPSSAKQGRVKWAGLVPGSLIGRIEMSNPVLRYAGSFSCGACSACSQYQDSLSISPGWNTIVDGNTQFLITYYTTDCLSGNSVGPYTLDPAGTYWTSDNSSAVSMSTSGNATPIAAGIANVSASAQYTGPAEMDWNGNYNGCTVDSFYQTIQVQTVAPYVANDLNNLESALVGYDSIDGNGNINNAQLDPDAYNYLVSAGLLSPSDVSTTTWEIPKYGPVLIVVTAVYLSLQAAKALETWSEARGLADPKLIRTLGYSQPGTYDSNGNCDPNSPPTPNCKWQAVNFTGRAAGFVHWHWTEWDLNTAQCIWYLSRNEGSDDPGPNYVLIPGIY